MVGFGLGNFSLVKDSLTSCLLSRSENRYFQCHFLLYHPLFSVVFRFLSNKKSCKLLNLKAIKSKLRELLLKIFFFLNPPFTIRFLGKTTLSEMSLQVCIIGQNGAEIHLFQQRFQIIYTLLNCFWNQNRCRDKPIVCVCFWPLKTECINTTCSRTLKF